VLVRLLDQGRQPQLVELPTPVLTTAVRIEVLEEFGSGDGDVSVSDLGVYGWLAGPEDRELAHQRAEVRPATKAIVLSTR
jgi:hypothetical protein